MSYSAAAFSGALLKVMWGEGVGWGAFERSDGVGGVGAFGRSQGGGGGGGAYILTPIVQGQPRPCGEVVIWTGQE